MCYVNVLQKFIVPWFDQCLFINIVISCDYLFAYAYKSKWIWNQTVFVGTECSNMCLFCPALKMASHLSSHFKPSSFYFLPISFYFLFVIFLNCAFMSWFLLFTIFDCIWICGVLKIYFVLQGCCKILHEHSLTSYLERGDILLFVLIRYCFFTLNLSGLHIAIHIYYDCHFFGDGNWYDKDPSVARNFPSIDMFYNHNSFYRVPVILEIATNDFVWAKRFLFVRCSLHSLTCIGLGVDCLRSNCLNCCTPLLLWFLASHVHCLNFKMSWAMGTAVKMIGCYQS